MNGTVEKPPLGAKPYALVHEERIGDLAGAILRQTQRSGNTNFSLITVWAYEILELAQLTIRLKEKYEERGK